MSELTPVEGAPESLTPPMASTPATAAAPEAAASEAAAAVVSAETAKTVSVRALLEAGAHLGHRANRWNPKMRPYIYGTRNGISIIDLRKSAVLFRDACDAVARVAARGDSVLFVCTKKQGQMAVAEEAARAGMPYVTQRWLGGMLTNFQTIKQSIDKLKRFEEMERDGTLSSYTKKEQLTMNREREKLMRNLGGIREMPRLPGAIFVIDTNMEALAITEAKRLGMPIIAVVDTNSTPDDITHPIPANDDAIRVIRLVASKIADACIEGKRSFEEIQTARREEARTRREPAAPGSDSAPRKASGGGKVEVVVKKRTGGRRGPRREEGAEGGADAAASEGAEMAASGDSAE